MFPAIETFWPSLVFSLALSMATLLSIRVWRAYIKRTRRLGADGDREAVEREAEAGVERVDGIAKTAPDFAEQGSGNEVTAASRVYDEAATCHRRILLIDNEKLSRAAAAKALSEAGFDVDAADDAQQAVELHRQAMNSGKRYDIAILDLSIRGATDKAEALLGIREIDPGLPAVISSGDCSHPLMVNFRDYGFAARLAKPYKGQDLLKTLHEVLEGQSVLQQQL